MNKKEAENIDLSDKRAKYFMSLYIATQRRLYGFVLCQIPNPSDADDIVQETVSVMWSKFHEYKPGTNFAAWTLCIARYQILTHRKKYLKDERQFSELTLEAIQEVAESSDSQEQDRKDALRLCMKKLEETEQKMLYVRYEIGATLQSASQQLNMNINTFYSALSRVHILLLNCIRKKIENPGIKP